MALEMSASTLGSRPVQARFGRWSALASGRRRLIHRNCGQLCGQPFAKGLLRIDLQGPGQIAQLLSTNKALKIKHLDDCECDVTVTLASHPMFGALVDFSGRSQAGFADD